MGRQVGSSQPASDWKANKWQRREGSQDHPRCEGPTLAPATTAADSAVAPVVHDISSCSSARLDLSAGDDMLVGVGGRVNDAISAAGGLLLDDEGDSCQTARRSLHFEEDEGCVATAGV